MIKKQYFLGAFLGLAISGLGQRKLNEIAFIKTGGIKFSKLNESINPGFSGNFSLVFNQKFIAGFALNHVFDFDNQLGQTLSKASMKGVHIAYVPNPSKKIHLGFPFEIGKGHLTEQIIDQQVNGSLARLLSKTEAYSETSLDFCFVQPAVALERNLNKHFALCLISDYRLVFKSSSPLLSAKKLSGFGVQVGLKAVYGGSPFRQLNKKLNN